ncbi:MAG: hypothetical protein ACHREM_03280 [Polyangiales bacterium]
MKPSIRHLRSALCLVTAFAVVTDLAACKPKKPAAAPSDEVDDEQPAGESSDVADKHKAAEDAVAALIASHASTIEEMTKVVAKHKKAIEAIDAYEKAASDAPAPKEKAAPKKESKADKDERMPSDDEDEAPAKDDSKKKKKKKDDDQAEDHAKRDDAPDVAAIVKALRKKAWKALVDRAMATADALEKAGDPANALQALIFVQRKQWDHAFPLEKKDLSDRFRATATAAAAHAKEVFATDKSWAALGGFVTTKPIAAGEVAQSPTYLLAPSDKANARIYFADTLKAIGAGKKLAFTTSISCYTAAAAKSATSDEQTAVLESKAIDTKKSQDKKYVEFPMSLAALVPDGIGLCAIAASGKADGADAIEADGIWIVALP